MTIIYRMETVQEGWQDVVKRSDYNELKEERNKWKAAAEHWYSMAVVPDEEDYPTVGALDAWFKNITLDPVKQTIGLRRSKET